MIAPSLKLLIWTLHLLLTFAYLQQNALAIAQAVPSVNVTKFFASTRTVGYLAKVEQMLIPALYEYKKQLENHYNIVKTFIDEAHNETVDKSTKLGRKVQNTRFIDIDDLTEEISGNPLHVFLMFKRFDGPWSKMEKLVETWSHQNQVLKNKTVELQVEMKFPGQADMVEAITSLVKLKKAFELPASSLIKGKLKDMETNSGLNAEQCYELGKFTLRYQVFTTCIDFLNEGLRLARRISRSNENGDKCKEKSCLELRFESIMKLAITRHDMKLDNGTFEATGNPFHFTRKLENFTSHAFKTRVPKNIFPEYKNESDFKGAYRSYELLCNGATLKSANESKLLFCKLETQLVHPYYRIRPLKIEVHNLSPMLLVQIYDVMTDKEMEAVIDAAIPRMQRSSVIGTNESNTLHHSRTSSNTFLQDCETESQFLYLNRRIQRISGLKTSIVEAAEDLQVANYGPGEFYAPHFDGGDRDEDLEKLVPFHRFRGDRLATFMIYLNDGFRGGSTAFPRLGIAVKPVKGSAVLWYNLRHDGTLSRLSLHAGCPVLYGSKWISNKWIRSHEQMFLKKCELTQPPPNPVNPFQQK